MGYHEQGLLLHKVQEIELEVIQRRKRIRDIDEEVENSASLAAAQAVVDQIQEDLAPYEEKKRELELQIQLNADKQQESEAKLYDGSVTNPKELQDLQTEVDSLKRWHEELGKRLHEVYQLIDAKQVLMDEAQTELESATEEVREQQKELNKEKKSLEKENKALLEKRKEIAMQISRDNFVTYNDMRRKKANRPMSILNENSCSVCGIEQTTAVIREVKSDENPVYCINCGRILVYKP